MKDRAGTLPGKFDVETWEGTWYDLDEQLLPYPEALQYLVIKCKFSDDEAEEYLAIINAENWTNDLL